MNNQKAIEYFYRVMELGNIRNDTEQEAYELAIQALEKQIPRKPKEIDDDYGYFKCSHCNQLIYYSDVKEAHKHCLNCGQRLDWSD